MFETQNDEVVKNEKSGIKNRSFNLFRDENVKDENFGATLDENLKSGILSATDDLDEKGGNILMGNVGSGNENISEEMYDEDMMILKALEESGDGNIKYIDNQTNLEIPNITSMEGKKDKPVSAMKKMGEYLSEKIFYNKFMNEVEKVGEDVARYKWAYDEGKFGEFDSDKFISEVFKAGLRGAGSGSLRMIGNTLNILGSNLENSMGLSVAMSSGAGIVLPKAKEVFNKLGNVFNEYAQKVENLEILAPSYEAYQEDPNWMSVANVIGQGSGSVLSMGGISKIIGSKATYGLFAIGGGGEVFKESMEKDGDVNKANVLGAMSASSSYLIDKIFNPLPKQFENGVKATSSLIAKEMVGAPLREAGSEMLQQVVSENLVRKIGIDDTQNLFEGMIESAVGAMAGNAVVAGGDGGIYYATKRLEDLERRMKLRGVTDEDIELSKKSMLEFIETKPEAFEKILGYNLEQNIKEIINEGKTRKERKETKKELEALPRIYEKMYDRLKGVVDENVAKASARMFEASALFWQQQGVMPRYLEVLEGYLPEVKKDSFDNFLANNDVTQANFQFVGINAKNIDYSKLSLFKKMEGKKLDPQIIWRQTGGFRGDDGKIRFEINSDDAKLKIFEDRKVEKYQRIYREEILRDLEVVKRNLAYSLISRDNPSYASLFGEFYNYLKAHNNEIDLQRTSRRGNLKLYNRQNFNELIDEKVRVRRKYEQILLDNIYENYKNGKNNLGEDGEKYIKGLTERERFDNFVKSFWNIPKEKALNDFSLDIMKDNSSWMMSEEFKNRLNKLASEFKVKRRERKKELKKLGIYNNGRYFSDLDLEESYRIKLVGNNESDENIELMDFRPERYKRAYEPASFGEKFLAENHYDFFEGKVKDEVLGYLDNVEKYYRLEKYLEWEKGINYAKIAEDSILDGEDAKNTNDTKLLVHNGKQFMLGDILEYDELFLNYPELKKSKVLITRLVDGEPYHFYWNKDEGYVFEIDGEQCDSNEFFKILLKGTNFAVQHKEGFDYTLTDKQRKNHMDRYMYLAKKHIADEAKDELQMFLMRNGIINDEKDVNKYWKVTKMPMSMLNIFRSKSVDAKKIVKPRNINYGEIDFDKLSNDIQNKFLNVENYHQEQIRKQMLADLYSFKERIYKKVMYEARRESGYRDVGLAWGGVVSQGNTDEFDLLKPRFVKTKVAENAMVELDPQIRYKNDINFNIDNEKDIMNTSWDERKMYASDRMALDFIDRKAAKGAYDFGNNVISVFEGGSSETILHESFHYFYEFLKKSGKEDNVYVKDVFRLMNEIKVDFLGRYDLEERDGRFFAVDEDGNNIYEQVPLGYSSEAELLDNVAKEVFVERLLRIMDGKNINLAKFGENIIVGPNGVTEEMVDEYASNPNSKVEVDSDLMQGVTKIYFKWLKYMAKALDIEVKKSGKGGKKILKTLGIK